jgi:hypothetical protein
MIKPQVGEAPGVHSRGIFVPEADLAGHVIILKVVRLFFLGDNEETSPRAPEAEELLAAWHMIPVERREAALLEFQRQLWQGLLDRLENSSRGPQPGEEPYRYLVKEGAEW